MQRKFNKQIPETQINMNPRQRRKQEQTYMLQGRQEPNIPVSEWPKSVQTSHEMSASEIN